MLDFNWTSDRHLCLVLDLVGIIMVLRSHVAYDALQVSFEDGLLGLLEINVLLDLHNHFRSNTI